MTDFLDRLASDLLFLEADLRIALDAMRKGRAHPRILPQGWDQLRVGTHEVRTMLRGAMPVPIAMNSLRGQHARMTTALSIFATHLVTLNEPHPRSFDGAIAAGAALMTELREWQRRAEWKRATRAARVKGWACPPPITAVIGLQVPEHAGNAHAGTLAHPAATMRLVRQLGADRQLQLDLALPAPAELVDLRQLRLKLVA